jgi:ribosomal protein L16 Arg81 hydroxylase
MSDGEYEVGMYPPDSRRLLQHTLKLLRDRDDYRSTCSQQTGKENPMGKLCSSDIAKITDVLPLQSFFVKVGIRNHRLQDSFES